MLENCLRAKRIERGLSQKAVAKEVGLTRQALYSIESNHYWPSTEISLRLAKILNCRVEDLFRLETGNEMIASMDADLVSYGTLFISNPDLSIRFERNAPLIKADPTTIYKGGAKGYVDYPILNDTVVNTSNENFPVSV